MLASLRLEAKANDNFCTLGCTWTGPDGLLWMGRGEILHFCEEDVIVLASKTIEKLWSVCTVDLLQNGSVFLCRNMQRNCHRKRLPTLTLMDLFEVGFFALKMLAGQAGGTCPAQCKDFHFCQAYGPPPPMVWLVFAGDSHMTVHASPLLRHLTINASRNVPFSMGRNTDGSTLFDLWRKSTPNPEDDSLPQWVSEKRWPT